jgi:hypothetical protein
MLLDDLAWIDRRESRLGSVTGTLAQTGAWSQTAVRGAFRRMFGGYPAEHNAAAALVYAGVART